MGSGKKGTECGGRALQHLAAFGPNQAGIGTARAADGPAWDNKIRLLRIKKQLWLRVASKSELCVAKSGRNVLGDPSFGLRGPFSDPGSIQEGGARIATAVIEMRMSTGMSASSATLLEHPIRRAFGPLPEI